MSTTHTADGIQIDTEYEYEEFWWKDYKNDIDVKVAVNWNRAVSPAKSLKLTWRDRRNNDQELILDREEVQTIMFLLAREEEEDGYLQARTQQLKKQRHEFRVKAGKRIEKGEEIVINKMITQ